MPHLPRFAALFLCNTFAVAPLRAAEKPPDRPLPPAAAAKAMTVPPGFKVTLFAGEPDVVQPIAMTFDDRGRLWVVECRSYPKWASDGTGHDRVVIFEDTDHDGTFDKRTVFLDNGSNLSGIELGFGGVWLCSLPNLVFIPVKPGEDKPAGPAEIVLDGWNLKDTKHNVFNSLGWGPDGWLYGCNGIQAKSRVGRPGTPDKDRVFLDCGVWRYHPTKKTFELYASGTTNPFGLDWDEYGQMFITNCVIDHLWHVVPGAHFTRMYGEDPNPYTFGAMGPCSDHKHWAGGGWQTSRGTAAGVNPEHSDAGGGHAHAGCAIYLGDNFPPEYRNSLFTCNLHGARLNQDKLERTAAGYVGTHGKDFLFANDPWFRGLCVKVGPDGGLYVSDWTDTGECHNYKDVDPSNGRIYKVTHGTPKPWTDDLSKKTSEELAELAVESRNEWASRHARRLLQERAAAGPLPFAVTQWLAGRVPAGVTSSLRAAWTLHNVGALGGESLNRLLAHDDARVRAWGVVLAAEVLRSNPREAVDLLPLARQETNDFVRLHLAAALQRLPDDAKLSLAAPLFARDADTNLSLMFWYGIQPAVLTRPTEVLALLPKLTNDHVRGNVIRLALTMPGGDQPRMLAEVVKVLGAASSDPARRDIMRAIQIALAGRRNVPAPVGWDAVYQQMQTSPEAYVRNSAEALAVTFGDEVAIEFVRKRLTDPKAKPDARVAAVELLVRHKVPDLAPVLQELVADPLVRGPVLRALAAVPDDKTPAVILAKYAAFTPVEKADAVQTLASRPAFAAALLDAVAKGAVPRADVPVVAARQILALNDKALADRLGTVWGVIRPVSKDRAKLFAKWKPALDAKALKAADVANGRAVFVKSCAACHKLFGEGGDVGPELTGSQRASLDYVLENVLDPNAVVAREYQMVNFGLADGRTVGGLVLRETADAVTVRTPNDTVLLAKGDIDGRKPTTQSIMPEGLLDALKPEDARDLVAYLASPAQVPPK